MLKQVNFKKQDFGIYGYDTNVMKYIKASSDVGIYITRVVENTAAEKAGIKKGDIILNVDGQTLKKMSYLRRYIYTKKPKEEVILKIFRDKREMELKIKLR